MKTIKDFNFTGKRVLARVDFNVPLTESGEISDDFRIKAVLPTLDYLIKKGAKIILISHFEPKEGKPVSLKQVALRLEELLNPLKFRQAGTNGARKKIKFLPDCLGKDVKQVVIEMEKGDIILLENLRFYKEEKDGDLIFARRLSSLGNIFLQEAFSVCHRSHASVVGIPKYLPSAAGPLLEKEINILSKVVKKPNRPLVAIIGGIKISAKIGVINKFLKVADSLLFSSKIGEEYLSVHGILVRESILGRGEVEKIKEIKPGNHKIHLPMDVIASSDESGSVYTRQTSIGQVKKGERILDIGQETISLFSKIIKEAKTIFWAGPLGLYEKKEFEKGTKEIAKAIARNFRAFRIAGGGDTLSAIKKFNLENKFDFLSTGGSAMLMFLAGEKLPGIEALE